MRIWPIFIFSIMFLFMGCSLAPKLEEPSLELPNLSNTQIQKEWWRDYEDENLNSMISEAIKNNSDIEQATIKIEQARANLRLKESNQMPNIIANVNISKSHTSQNYPPFKASVIDDYTLSGSISYELDLFDRLKDSTNMAKELFLAEEYNKELIKELIVSQVLNSYIRLIILTKQQEIANQILKSYEETVNFRKRQFQKGLITELILHQVEAEMESIRADLNSILNLIEATKSTLALLLGKSPKEIFESSKIELIQNSIKKIELPKNLPSSILEQRADIKKALAQLRASNFSIGIAKAGYFPVINLTASSGFKSSELDKLFVSDSGIWGIGANLLTPIFDFNRVKSQVDSALESQKLALSIYIQSIKKAFKEIKDALDSYEYELKRQEALKKQQEALVKSLFLAQKRFDEGYSNYLEVLDAQRALFKNKIAMLNSELALQSAIISFYKSIGACK